MDRSNRPVPAATLPALLLAALLAPGLARGGSLEVELWCDLDPIVQEGTGRDVGRLNRDEAVRRLLEEARTTVSAMVYGYAFVYTPGDASRAVEELFELTPRGEIPWGDPALTVAATRLAGDRLHALLRYEMSEEQESWRAAFASGTVAKTAGEGAGNVFLGYRERLTALTNAMKESVRSHLRPRLLNKPREVSGAILLWDLAGTRIASGEYRTRVVTRLRLDAVIPYRAY